MIYNITNEEKDFLHVVFSGNITEEEIINGLNNSLPEVASNTPDLKILIDGIKCNLNINIRNLHNILSENQKLLSKYSSIKIAIIVDNPINTAIAMIYKRRITNDQLQFNLFSTKLLAISWIEKSTFNNSMNVSPRHSY